MFSVITLAVILLDAWGMTGNWTTSVIRQASSLTGPSISSAVIDASPGGGSKSHRAPLYFLFALDLVSAAGIFMFLDVDKNAKEQNAFLREKAVSVYGVALGTDGDGDGNND
ncbi:hypothetical protein HC256_002522 [Beauveria bassiana]|nr:hypothetical protein HC256_002522 [Beauveria bassiana]